MTHQITPETPLIAAGFGRSLRRSLLILAATALPAFAQTLIQQKEQDDTLATANPTLLTSTHTGVVIAFGSTADGAYGRDGEGNGTGDFDFYKVSAAAGQPISVYLMNNAVNYNFDSYVAVYTSAGVKVADNDDGGDGTGRASKLVYTPTAAGDYYVMTGNWINGPSNDPSDPNTAGTGGGPGGEPSGSGGAYRLVIGLASPGPALQFNGGVSDNPSPVIRWVRIPGGTGYRMAALATLTNVGTTAYALTAYSVTGTDAAKYTITGLSSTQALAVGASVQFTIVYDGDAAHPVGNGFLSLTDNDPTSTGFPLTAPNSAFSGGGFFTVKQVKAATGTVGDFTAADGLLTGTNAGATATGSYPVINFLGDGTQTGSFGGDSTFPLGASNDNYVSQATGNIFIRTAGSYTFRGFSDDGERLTIDGTPVFETTGANVYSYGTVDLTVGTHALVYTQYDGAAGDSAELAVAQTADYFYPYNDSQTNWELVEAYSPDIDGDTLPDAWEVAHGLDPNSAVGVNGATGDPDADGLSNFNEYIAGTDPQNPDTDGDGLKDGVETNTGTWVDATHTGTDPLNPDTDGDGLSDSVENPTQASTGISQPGTDPNKADTDGDGYGDLSEITLGTNPKLASSVPSFTYSTILAENFDGAATNSVYAFTNTSGAAPSVTASGVAASGNSAQLTSATAGINNSIAWNSVPTGSPQTVKLTFDFRIGNTANAADGFGIGLFGTNTYGTTGGINPGDGKNWENPTANGGYPDALVLGFGVYGTNAIRMTGPAAPGVALVEQLAPFALTNNVFNRATLTAVTSGSAGTLLSLTIIQDVNGATPTTRPIFSNVLVKNFDLATQQFRLIAGGRTGQLFTQIDLDNVLLSTAGTTTTAPAPTISIARTTGQPAVTYTGVLQSSPDLVTFTDVVGATSPYTVPAGSPAKMFYRSRQP